MSFGGSCWRVCVGIGQVEKELHIRHPNSYQSLNMDKVQNILPSVILVFGVIRCVNMGFCGYAFLLCFVISILCGLFLFLRDFLVSDE